MKDSGFIALDRNILEWEWYKEPNTKNLFIHCLLKANWKDSKFQGYEIPRGSFVTSRKNLAEELGMTEQQIRTALNHLISTSELTNKTTTKFSIITIKNYDKYQNSNRQSTSKITNNQPTTNQQLTTIEQSNNIYTNNNNTIYTYVEENFGRTLSPVEVQEIFSWKDNELTRYAIKQSVLSAKCNVKYISRILLAYERENVKTVQQAQIREREYVEAKKKKNLKKVENKLNESKTPIWFDKNVESEVASVEEQETIKKMLEELKEG